MVSISPRRAFILTSVAAILALAAPQFAQAGFSSQLVPVAGPLTGGNSGIGEVTTGSNGESLVVWTDGDANDVAVRARRIKPDGSMGGVIEVTDGSTRAADPHVDFASNGRAIVGWIESESFSKPQSVRARWIEPDDSMTKAITVKVGNATDSEPGELDLAATADDGAILAWHNFKSKPAFRIIEAQYVTAGSAVSEPILPTSGAGATHVQVAPTTFGGSVMAWRETSVLAQGISQIGTVGTLMTPGSGVNGDPELETDGHDHFQLVYRVGSNPFSIVYQPLGTDANFGPVQELDPTAAEQAFGISVATNSANRSVVSWVRSGTSQTVKARFINPDGSLDATTLTSAAGPEATATSAGIGGLGGAAISWTQSPTPESAEVWGRILPPGGPPQAPTRLSTGSDDSGTPELDIGADELGLVAWSERLVSEAPEPSFRIFARQILPPPTCPDAGGTIVQGQPTRISLNCTGVQIEAPAIVGQAEHGRLTDIDAATQSVLYTPQPGFAGDDSFRFSGANPGGPGAVQTARLKVGKDTVKPRVKRFSISKRHVRGKKATFRLRYSEIATATIAIERGRRCGGVAGVSSHCKKFKKLGALRAKPPGISAKVVLRKRVGGKRLVPGTYRATAIATDPAGNRSKPKRLTFSVVSG